MIRSTAVYDEVSNSVYSFGGEHQTDIEKPLQTLSILLKFDLSTSVWSIVTPRSTTKPHARFFHACGIYERKIYIFGGFGSPGFTSDIWVYDIIRNEWFKMLPSGTPPKEGRGETSYSIITTKNQTTNETEAYLYIFGGRRFYGSSGVMNDFYKYNIINNTWTKIGSSENQLTPSPRVNAVVFVVYPFYYIFGGSDEDGFFLNEMWRFNMETQLWERVNQGFDNTKDTTTTTLSKGNTIPDARDRHTIVQHELTNSTSSICLFAGYDGYPPLGQGFFGDLWEFDTGDLLQSSCE
eukprot:TRINITY_DN7051_c0_g1_i2.p1 TRINITY_DN7051_c0_g1~~TRINITY_DN7051_c0_g1_i2.p1  ORF type:complete len:294 (+),score=59.30 TRINITY_DN7051_c0_g1_i2:340-1221(+)